MPYKVTPTPLHRHRHTQVHHHNPHPLVSGLGAQVRLYRVQSLFRFLEYNLSFSLLNVTIVRNLAVGSTHKTCLPVFYQCMQRDGPHKVGYRIIVRTP